MFELTEPMAAIPSNTEPATDSTELDNMGKLFGDEESTDSQQILDSLFAGMED
jgi:hypothetical protein